MLYDSVSHWHNLVRNDYWVLNAIEIVIKHYESSKVLDSEEILRLVVGAIHHRASQNDFKSQKRPYIRTLNLSE